MFSADVLLVTVRDGMISACNGLLFEVFTVFETDTVLDFTAALLLAAMEDFDSEHALLM